MISSNFPYRAIVELSTPTFRRRLLRQAVGYLDHASPLLQRNAKDIIRTNVHVPGFRNPLARECREQLAPKLEWLFGRFEAPTRLFVELWIESRAEVVASISAFLASRSEVLLDTLQDESAIDWTQNQLMEIAERYLEHNPGVDPVEVAIIIGWEAGQLRADDTSDEDITSQSHMTRDGDAEDSDEDGSALLIPRSDSTSVVGIRTDLRDLPGFQGSGSPGHTSGETLEPPQMDDLDAGGGQQLSGRALSRAEAQTLIDRGRQLTRDVEDCLAIQRELLVKEQEAFSTGRGEELRERRRDRELIEETALSKKLALGEVLKALATHAGFCVQAYRIELSEAGEVGESLSVPSVVGPDRIEECRHYFESVEEAVNLISSRLFSLRSRKLSPELQILHGLLEQLLAFDDDLPSTRAYLADETYLDLSLSDARNRLRTERGLIAQRLEVAARRRREQETKARVERAREALERLCNPATNPSSLKSDDVRIAAMLCENGTSTDARRFWSSLGRLLDQPLEDEVYEQAAHVAGEALVRCLDATADDPPLAFLGDLGEPGRRGLDAYLGTAPDKVVRILESARISETEPVVFISRVVRLKEYVPSAAFAILRMASRFLPLNSQELATWFLAKPRQWEGAEHSVSWLATQLERRGEWKEASASWGTLDGEANSQRCLATRLIALAENDDLVPNSDEAWLEALSGTPGLFGSDVLAAAVAVSTLVVAYRSNLPMRELLESFLPPLHHRPAIEKILQLSVQAWPQRVCDALVDVDTHMDEYHQVSRAVDRILNTAKTPGGKKSHEFHRDILLPKLRQMLSKNGPGSLRHPGAGFLRELITSSGIQLNPTAVQAMERDLEELGNLATKLDLLTQNLSKGSTIKGSREIKQELESERVRLGPTDTLVQWAYTTATELLENRGRSAGGSKPSIRVSLAPTPLAKVLFPDNPIVDLRARPDLAAADLFEAALEEMKNADGSAEWRVKYALEQEAFRLAEQYCELLMEPERTRVGEYVAKEWDFSRKDIVESIELISAVVSTLDSNEDLEIPRMLLEEVQSALDARDLSIARVRIGEAFTECDRIERAWRKRQEERLAEIKEALARAFEMVCGQAGGRSDFTELVIGAVRAAEIGGLSESETYALAIRELLAGREFDRTLLTRKRHIPEDTRNDLLPDVKSVLDGGTTIVKDTPRVPLDLKKLPQLVYIDLEHLLQNAPSGELDPDTSSRIVKASAQHPYRERAAAQLFRITWRTDGEWEDPIVAFCEERGRQALAQNDFLRAAEYYRAAAQVGYLAGTRLSRGLDSVRAAAYNYGIARLMRLRVSSGQRPRPVEAVVGVAPRDWVVLTREFLLLRGHSDVADLFVTLWEVALDLTPECLELPLNEQPSLRTVLVRALVERVDQIRGARLELLQFILTYALPTESRQIVVDFLRRLSETAGFVSDTTVRPADSAKLIGELEVELRSAPLDETISQIFDDTLLRLQFGASLVTKDTAAEINVSSITREVFLDALESSEDIPLHIRLSVSPTGAVLRDLAVTVRAEHADLQVSPATEDVAWLRADEPVELSYRLRRRPFEGEQSSRVRSAAGELAIEVIDIGVRHGVTVSGGVIPYKGRRLSIQLNPRYPYGMRLNPYSPGPVIKELELIKGRDEEVRDILRTLRGKYQDNVPLVWGPRRIGKSTLLYKLKLDPEVRRHYEPVICDMEGLVRQQDDTQRFLTRMVRRISEELRGTAAGRLAPPELKTPEDALDSFQAYIDSLASACGDRSLLLMFDEMELFFDALRERERHPESTSTGEHIGSDVIQLLRHNMQHNRRVSFILAGTERLVQMAGTTGERFFHLPVPVQLGELRETEALALITEPVGNTFSYSAAARQEMLRLTARHPYLLQAVCHEVFSFMQDARLAVCSTSELKRVIAERVLLQAGYFDFQVRPLRRSSIRALVGRSVAELTQEERRTDTTSVMARLQLRNAGGPTVNVTEELRALVEEGILSEWRGKEYRFKFPIVGTYVAAQISE